MSVKVEHSVTAKCKPEHVWQKFQKLEEWSWWNRVIGQARWTSGPPWQPGSRFDLEMTYPKRIAMKTVISESAAPQAIAWKSDGGGLSGTMRFAFTPQNDGNTLLKAEAEFSGWKTIGGGIQEALKKAYEEWLGALKTEAEKIAREELART